MDDDCNICSKKMNHEDFVIKCKLKSHFVHLKCAILTLDEFYSCKKYWSCETCKLFPYATIDHHEFSEIIQTSSTDYISSTSISNLDDKKNDLPKLTIPNVYLEYSNEISQQKESDDILPYSFQYYTKEDFKRNNKDFDNTFSLFHTNIRPIEKNFENLELFFSDLQFEFDVIGLTETWGKSRKSKKLQLNNYHSLVEIYGQSQNSGCGLYVKKSLNFKVRNDLNKSYALDGQEFSIFMD